MDISGQTLIDRYYIRRRVGSGGMAIVYEAWDKSRSARLALKVLRKDLARDPRWMKRFMKEANLLKQLDHPNIVRLYEFQADGDTAFIVLDWVDGVNLRDVIAKSKKPLALKEVSRTLLPICSALQYAHRNMVFHCDVKPANILLHKDGRVLLTDFGVARLASDEAAGGTPPYMAPEQFTAAKVDGRTDIYALGVTLYEELSGGKVPFTGDGTTTPGTTSRERIGWEIINLPPSSLRTHNNGISHEVDSVVLAALNKDPNLRHQTPNALQEAFEQARRTPHPSRSGDTRIEVGLIDKHKSERKIWPGVTAPALGEKGSPRLVVIDGTMAGASYQVPSSGFTIGRHRSNTVRFSDRSVSRRHASIIHTRRGVYIRDEGSTLGTYVNGEKIFGPTRLEDGDTIRIGYENKLQYRKR